jgi:hypothetical protein
MQKKVHYIIKSRSESYCVKPRDIEDRDEVEVELGSGRSTKRPSALNDIIYYYNVSTLQLKVTLFELVLK